VFYREHIEQVQRFVARRVDDPFLAADLTAEVFLAAIDSAHSYRPGRGSPTGWLYGVAQNVVSSERRRQARELRANQRISGRRLLSPDDVSRLEERIDAEAGARGLLQAMEKLPAGERAVLELVALEGITSQEAAQVLGIRAATARVRLHRARVRLRDSMPPPPTSLVDITPEATS
jgi:RNA polymerase sigma-70 factor (ECF subfamily)